MIRILGLDPSLSCTGWGIIDVDGNKLKYVADGFIKTDVKAPTQERLLQIHNELNEVIKTYKPNEASIEEVFVNSNALTSLKLGQARGIVMLAPTLSGIPLFEYEPTKVKKAVVGVGRAEKNQVLTMVKILLPGSNPKNLDSSDALALAICHNSFRKNI
ncbi:MAG: crossover junction endodeoxyribonuclease RuvC [Alphaproteobacteria bacterium]